LLETYRNRNGGHLIDREEIMRVVSTVPAERSDSAVMAHFELLLKRHDVILFDDFTSLQVNGWVHYPTFGYRSLYFARFLVPLMQQAVVRAGKRLVLAGRPVLPKGSSVPDRLDFLYGTRQVALVNIDDPDLDDYRAIAANVLGANKAEGVDFKCVHDFASQLNCYQLSITSQVLSDLETPTTQEFIRALEDCFVRTNTRTDEVEVLDFDTMPGSEEIIAKLEKQVVLPLENHELAEQLDLKPKRGVLLYGPPGTGKTSIGRALAHRMKGKFFLIDGSIVTDWPGAFFGNVKRIIDQAKECAPSVVFIDDADVLFTIPHIAGFPRYLLSLLDGVESATAGKVCVMMTAMDVSKIPDALLRSGRVELWLETRLPSAEVRAQVLKRWMTRDLPESESVDYAGLAAVTGGLTPADLRRLVQDAKSLYAADRVRGRTPESAHQYLLRAIKAITISRERMSEVLNEPDMVVTGNSIQDERVDTTEIERAVLQ
jgi:ATP-dependent 26S proteasome regulatory subunit